MAKAFEGRVVFITGAAKGQGRAVALAFAREGASIAAFDLGAKIAYPAYNDSSTSDLERLAADVEAVGGRISIHTGDVRRGADVAAAVESAVAFHGGLDILFANAGICAYGLSHELGEDEWGTMIDINLNGAWLTSKHVIPHLIAKKRGVIIYNSSIGGLRGMNRLSHYAASKHALIGLARSQAIELAPHGIRVLSIHPTGVNTPMNDGLAVLEGATPIEIAERSAGNLLPVPWLEPEDVADSVLFLASDKARYVTGSQYVLDAGLLTR
ncbi:NAD(P)-dependent oxidoreductase [Siculibacillus lacustris]|uniref:NAD(P)-dependent oxidoreductase n=1 Tax=Siculibacillus lacustris TaxID=1549641 RepID=A0A4Q9VSV7_9HYPH|nr:SDR family oxidoreductase [Siculibacillus lacustris]TBW38975.1 NAD(P)-dependent oxidoreductase [Siculibacillus lacustris]